MLIKDYQLSVKGERMKFTKYSYKDLHQKKKKLQLNKASSMNEKHSSEFNRMKTHKNIKTLNSINNVQIQEQIGNQQQAYLKIIEQNLQKLSKIVPNEKLSKVQQMQKILAKFNEQEDKNSFIESMKKISQGGESNMLKNSNFKIRFGQQSQQRISLSESINKSIVKFKFSKNQQQDPNLNKQFHKSSLEIGFLSDSNFYLSDFKKFHFFPQFDINNDNKMIFKPNEEFFGFCVGYLTLLLIQQRVDKFKQLKDHIMKYNFNNMIKQNQEINTITTDDKQLVALFLKIINMFIEIKNVQQILNQYDIKKLILLIFQSFFEGNNIPETNSPTYFEVVGKVFGLGYSQSQGSYHLILDNESQIVIQKMTEQLYVYLV